MAAGDKQFKLYLVNGDKKMTLTEKHPKLDATNADWQDAASKFSDVYSMVLTEGTLTSETSVYTAS